MSRAPWAAALAAAAIVAAPMAARAAGGMTVTKDPQTGQLRAPTAQEMEALRAKENAAQAKTHGKAQTLVEHHHANGAVSVMLDESFMNYSVVTRNADGSLSEQCVVGSNAAQAIVSGKAKKPSAKTSTAAHKEHAHEVR
ncbi:MAG TPA: hypothetical protein VNU71_12195 [Burkholderiaceae bacterium]|nr:hypothetical protein [Burkholderiaceae bacterium]